MSYLINKKNRLKKKYTNILARDFGIIMKDSCTEIIVICNGGLCNGITYEMVWNVFHKFENFQKIVMVPGKSYSFIIFENKKNSEEAFNLLNDKIIWPVIKGPIFLGYVESINIDLLNQAKIFQKPPGLVLLEDFISEEEENEILKLLEFNESEKEYSSELKHRKVKHYGYEFKYGSNNINLNEPIKKIPSELNYLWNRLIKYSDNFESDFNFIPDQLTVNSYEPGQGIPPHVDTHSAFEDGILSLSLESSVVMEFKNDKDLTYSVLLPRRSLCLMLGESRYNWVHGITPRKSDLICNKDGSLTVQNRERRTSLTFRKTRSGCCTCKYPKFCDTAIEKLKNFPNVISEIKNINLRKEDASEIEKNFVHGVYDKIASHFSETRYKPWPNVFEFVNSFGPGSILVDVGCGNGKYFTKQSNRFEIGCDSNGGLMQVCKERGFECFSCNCLSIPLRDNIADGCICIAVIHHLTTEDRREKAIKEMIRILKSKGKALIYVWAKNQELKGEKSYYLKQNDLRKILSAEDDCKLKIIPLNKSQKELVLPVHNNRTAFAYNDMLVPWKLKLNNSNPSQAPVYLRFYHVYEDEELKNVCLKLENINILKYYYDQGNWCIILEKK